MTAQSTQAQSHAAADAAASAVAAAALSEPVHGAEITVPLNRLKASPKNARKVKHFEATLEGLAASIKVKGVLQPPVVEIERSADGAATGNYLVTIGEGRRSALRLLAKRKQIKRTHPVRVTVDTENDAHEISLDENITRQAMHPADQFEAFRRLAEENGFDPEEIGARFGVSGHVVRQRMRLERLAPGVGDGPAGRRVADRLEAWGARLPEQGRDLWAVLEAMASPELLDLMAVCAGAGLYAVRDPHDRKPDALAQAEVLATATGLDMTETWSATAASYFSRVSKARVLEAVTEATGGEEAGRIVDFKKGDMADAAERLVEGRGWLPTVLRTAPAVDPDAPEPEAGTREDGGAPDDDAYRFAAEEG